MHVALAGSGVEREKRQRNAGRVQMETDRGRLKDKGITPAAAGDRIGNSALGVPYPLPYRRLLDK